MVGGFDPSLYSYNAGSGSERCVAPNEASSCPIVGCAWHDATKQTQLLLLCRFSDAGNGETVHALLRLASEKRQGTKSRSVGHRRCSGRYGDLTAA
jgi:hypothetical protein